LKERLPGVEPELLKVDTRRADIGALMAVGALIKTFLKGLYLSAV